MKAKLSEFIQSKIASTEQSIAAREQASKVWRGGTDKSWRAAGCRDTKAKRLATADKEERILIKLRQELQMFNEVLETLLALER